MFKYVYYLSKRLYCKQNLNISCEVGDGMNQSESRFFRMLHVFAAFLTLQFLWFFFSLGVITVIPATISMYAIVVEWTKKGIDLNIWKSFFETFKFYFRRTILPSTNLSFVLMLLYMYPTLWSDMILKMPQTMSWLVLFATSLILLTVLSILPLIVTSHLRGRKLWKNAWITSICILPQVSFIGIVGGMIIFGSMLFPIILFTCSGLFAFMHMRIWQKSLKKLPSDFLDQCLLKYNYR